MENLNFFLHPEIANAPLPDEYKMVLQMIMDEHFNGDYDMLLEGVEKFMVDDEMYEDAAIVRDYRSLRKTMNLGIQNK